MRRLLSRINPHKRVVQSGALRYEASLRLSRDPSPPAQDDNQYVMLNEVKHPSVSPETLRLSAQGDNQGVMLSDSDQYAVGQ